MTDIVLQVGDRVRRLRHNQTVQGTVRRIFTDGRVEVRWDRGSWRDTRVQPKDLRLMERYESPCS